MLPKKFEELTRLVVERTGFERVTVTRYSQDGGIDVVKLTQVAPFGR